MTDDYYSARTRNRASTNALMKRSGYADGGDVRPTPRPGVDDLTGPFDPDFDTKVSRMGSYDQGLADAWRENAAQSMNMMADQRDRKKGGK